MERKEVNNTIYQTLGDKWYGADDDPIALLRAQGNMIHPWAEKIIYDRFGERKCKILDVGCGGGFLSNYLARKKHDVTGIDQAEDSLKVAEAHDETKTVNYLKADAMHLPFANEDFDVICAMDFLEHVTDPSGIVSEVSRVLKPKGLFIFHTFNRNPISFLLIIKGVEWFVKNTPPDLHVYHLFVKPSELREYCKRSGLTVNGFCGIAPVVFSKPFWKLLRTGSISKDFRFVLSKSLLTSYAGFAVKINGPD